MKEVSAYRDTTAALIARAEAAEAEVERLKKELSGGLPWERFEVPLAEKENQLVEWVLGLDPTLFEILDADGYPAILTRDRKEHPGLVPGAHFNLYKNGHIELWDGVRFKFTRKQRKQLRSKYQEIKALDWERRRHDVLNSLSTKFTSYT